MSTPLRLSITLASSILILTQSGCVSTSKFKSPQWLSFNREEAGVDATGLPDPSTLATPTTVTPASTEPSVTMPGDTPQVATNTGAPAATGVGTTTPPSITNVPPAQNYPSTNQPAPTQLAGGAPAGFLPGQAAPPTANVQQGLYQQPVAPTGTPPAEHVVVSGETPATPSPQPGALSTWDQPTHVPYPSSNPPGPQASPNPDSLYGGATSAGSTAAPSPMSPPSSGPDAFPIPGPAPSSQPIAPVTYDEPVPPPATSHYDRTAQNPSGGSGWRPGSTTNLSPTMR